MRIEQRVWTEAGGWELASTGLGEAAQLALIFGAPAALRSTGLLADVQRAFPAARLFGCSTAGEISGTRVRDDSLSVTGVAFGAARIESVSVRLSQAQGGADAGRRLAQGLEPGGLRHVLVLSDGLQVNGSELVTGLVGSLPEGVIVTGGLAGDGARFKETLVLHQGRAEPGVVAALGVYGDGIKIGYGSLGGWDPFGPERLVTRSRGNVLYELDGRSALELYRRYLGEHASGLPATGLLFPLSVRTEEGGPGVVRTILSVDEATQSMTFAGDLPQGAYARLMKANFDRLIDGAVGAARTTLGEGGAASPDLAICVSCVGRKLVLKQRTEEEVEGVRETLGARTAVTGFYSYGEISPFTPSARCELHNQTMTITSLYEP
jgi:hypothetical protein